MSGGGNPIGVIALLLATLIAAVCILAGVESAVDYLREAFP